MTNFTAQTIEKARPLFVELIESTFPALDKFAESLRRTENAFERFGRAWGR